MPNLNLDNKNHARQEKFHKKTPLKNATINYAVMSGALSNNNQPVSNRASIGSYTTINKYDSNLALPDEWYCWPYAKSVTNFDSIPIEEHVNVLKHPNNKKLHGIFIKYFIPNILNLCNKRTETCKNVRLCAARLIGLLLNVDYFVDYFLNKCNNRRNPTVTIIAEFITDEDEQIKLILNKYCENRDILDAFLCKYWGRVGEIEGNFQKI